jgi:alpha-D-ribose 1-methylphosphonate 5-triphosphate synthase subunit PhnH
MLLDNEVSFSVVSPQAVQVSRQLSQLTYAKAAMSDEADYVFILADADAAAVEHAVMTAKTGLLTNPELAATIVLEAKAIIPGEGLALRGPGVELVHFVSIDANGDWVGKRAQQVREFPLGIDMVFLDARGQVVCIPRTTTVEKQVTYGLCSC